MDKDGVIEPLRPANIKELLEWLRENNISEHEALFSFDFAPCPDIEFEFVRGQGIQVRILGEDEYEDVYGLDEDEDEE